MPPAIRTLLSVGHTLSLVRPVLAVLVLITDPAGRVELWIVDGLKASPEVNTFSGGAGELILTLLTIRADTFGLVISRVAVKLSITLPGGRDTETVRTPAGSILTTSQSGQELIPEVSRFTGV